MFLFILTHIVFVLFSQSSAETDVRRGGNLNDHLMARSVGNIRTINLKSGNTSPRYYP